MTSNHLPPHLPHKPLVPINQVPDLVGLAGVLDGQLSEDHDFGPELLDVLVHRGSKVVGREGLRYETVGLARAEDTLVCGFRGHGAYSHAGGGRG